MVKPGLVQTLKVSRRQGKDVVLDGGSSGELSLPGAELPLSVKPGDSVEVFAYLDPERRLVVTTRQPRAQLEQVATLRVVAVEQVGAFLDWGMPKDLLLPFGEQRGRPEPGRFELVKIIADRDGRLVASARLDRHLLDTSDSYRQGDRVELVAVNPTDLGYKVVVDNRFWGLISAAELRAPLRRGQRLSGYVQRLRPDQRLSISLNAPGAAKSDELAERVLARLEQEGGFLPLHDRSSPEAVFDMFRCSKGAFKQTIGKLYRARRISIDEDGIRLVRESR